MTAPTPREETHPQPRYRKHTDGRVARWFPTTKGTVPPWCLDNAQGQPIGRATDAEVHIEGWEEAALVGLPQVEELDRVCLTDREATPPQVYQVIVLACGRVRGRVLPPQYSDCSDYVSISTGPIGWSSLGAAREHALQVLAIVAALELHALRAAEAGDTR